ncbi:polysaccharide biosynthesis/export family protein [Salinimicrobium sp. TH3]|uniref:polysaccharide biosynthesis/export family protein n=1 Tax=Salinimicrobium sp. TH3 TaxID=2997342 RepID=UPI002275FFF8|nr:polysaccharide biosynthesis/export family protein [Salinimicrobium sp. TH3]MCY2687842.1 polysaccharide biosynthesis/export family protein [Salinimicrobium sp. TH3]
MSIRHLIVIVSVISFVSSCVPTKRLMYLQEDGVKTDSIIKVERIQKPYRIQVNDLLSIRVKAIDQDAVGMFNPIGDENLNATREESLYFDGFLVDAHGNIRVPTLGEVNVLGYTVEEVREKIEKALLEDYFKEQANIFVTVKLAGIRYTTIGEIGSGSQVIYKEQVTIMEAIANAGDITEFGDRTDVVIVRQYPGGEKRHHIDLTTIDAMRSPYYYIQPNDLIIVNPLPQKAWGIGTTGLSNFQTAASVLALVISSILIFTR